MMIYMAGPITATAERTVEQNVASAVAIYLRLIDAGVCAFCPHLSELVPEAFDIHYEKWLKYDFEIIRRADAVLMLPNWEMSKGACREYIHAKELNKQIFYDVENVIHAAGSK